MSDGLTEPLVLRGSPSSFSIWPLTLTAGFPLALVLIWSGPFTLGFVGAPVLLLTWSAATVLAIILGSVAIFQHAWRRAVSMLPLPLPTLTSALNFDTLWPLAISAGDHIHFRVMRG